MSATLLSLPGCRTITVPHLTATQKTAELEDLARAVGMTRHQTLVSLLSVAHPSLAGDDLWDLWHEAENAMGIRDVTPEDDGDYAMYAERAASALCDLIHGTARGSRDHTTGESA